MSVILSLLALASVASDPSQNPPSAEKPAEKKVCRFINMTGSRLRSERVCMTRKQWDRQSSDTAEQMERALVRPTGEPTNGPH